MAFRKPRRFPMRRRRKNVRGRVNNGRRIFRMITAGNTYRYKQVVSGNLMTLASTTITTSTLVQGASAAHLALAFCLQDLPQVSTFTTLYDQYRINKIVIDFLPTSIQVNNSGTASSNAGIFGTVIDYDDNTALSTYSQYTEYENFKYQIGSSMRKHTRVLRPHIAIAVYQGAFTGFANTGPKWIDCSNPNVAHYGVKVYVPPYGSTASAQTWYVQAKYYVSFKNVR